jgi:hypothetical protein
MPDGNIPRQWTGTELKAPTRPSSGCTLNFTNYLVVRFMRVEADDTLDLDKERNHPCFELIA